MSDLELTARIALLVTPAVAAAAWKLAVVYRITSRGYTYRSKGRWGETEIRPSDRDPPHQT